MAIDSAIEEAMTVVLKQHDDQSETFQRRYRNLVELVLTGNYEDADVRRVMELLKIDIEEAS